LPACNPAQVMGTLKDLEAQHARRRDWVWAKLGQARLALALRHLNDLAGAAEKPLAGATPAALADAYVAGGWKADDAMLAALAAVTAAEDVAAVQAAVQALYRPWLEKTTERFQSLVKDVLEQPRPGRKKG